MLAALTIGVSMRIVGILLIAALMVLPVIAAQRVAWSVRSTMGLSILFGLGSVLVGLTISYYGTCRPAARSCSPPPRSSSSQAVRAPCIDAFEPNYSRC